LNICFVLNIKAKKQRHRYNFVAFSTLLEVTELMYRYK